MPDVWVAVAAVAAVAVVAAVASGLQGLDLLARLIPDVCRAHPNVDFIIGGDGPKRTDLEHLREQHGLGDRVEMLGAVPHHLVRDVLVRGHLFLNCSLTEARTSPLVPVSSA